MDNTWNELMSNLDWGEIDREIASERGYDELLAYFNDAGFDYKRGYIRKFMRAHPEIVDRELIDMATEQMQESHDGGVELDVDDAIRFVANKRPMSVQEAVKLLTEAGITDENIEGVISSASSDGYGIVVNKAARKKAERLTRFADLLAQNPDVLILGIPVFDNQSNWTQAKLAFFSENFAGKDKSALEMMRRNCDRTKIKIEHGIAVVAFQIWNIWDDFAA